VWVAAHLGSPLCAELLIYVHQRHQLVVSPQVLREFERNLRVKFKVPEPVVVAWLTRISRDCLSHDPSGAAPKRSRDPKDDPIIQAALEAACDWLVSGDSDLTSLKRVKGMPICSPRDFLETMGVEEPFE
jgi:predicted nucleic acid-binding protein